MFLSLSKTLAKFGGFRLGLGIRITKKNALVMSFVLLFVLMFQAMWYMMVVCFWLMYAVMYGMWQCVKLPFRLLRKAARKGKKHEQ